MFGKKKSTKIISLKMFSGRKIAGKYKKFEIQIIIFSLWIQKKISMNETIDSPERYFMD